MYKNSSNRLLFVISAPSGAGKTSLIKALIEKNSSLCSVERVVTYTTRTPRPGERNHEDYHFITKEAFEEKIKENFFLEWSTAYQDYYGTAKDVIAQLSSGKKYIMILDRAGAQAVKKAYDQAVLIWITPPSLQVLQERLQKRGDSQKTQLFRLEQAAFELKEEHDHSFYDHVIINDHFSDALRDLRALMCG